MADNQDHLRNTYMYIYTYISTKHTQYTRRSRKQNRKIYQISRINERNVALRQKRKSSDYFEYRNSTGNNRSTTM